ncbi:MAG: outer membrane protein multidrug efflux system [Bryobacterales bacterium]|nr:outer membrane protein multidrug efflux system [Bryobacterales bacterium]
MRNFKMESMRLAGAITLVSLAGCTVGPKYHQPVPPVPTQFKEGGTPDSGTPEIAYSDWWRVFHDPQLDRLETEADAANQDIRLAVARVDQADAGARYARSFLFPTISLGASASRTREAQTRPNNGNTNGLAATFNDFQLPAFFSYEVDAWGRVRHSIEAANATEQATAADVRFVRLAVEANVAMDYYALRENDAERKVLDSTVQEMQQAVDLTSNRFRGGLTSELEVKQAQTLLSQTQSQAQALDVQRSQLDHAIAVLTGKAASEFSIPPSPLPGREDGWQPPAIPSGLPAELLGRRPDIAEVERYVAAANAQVGVAKTAALPHISLTGLAGFETTNMTSLFSWQNSIASLGASAVTPLFTGGRVRSGVDQAWAVYRQSLAQYQKTVLTAYQEVEDQLAALRILNGEAQSTADAVTYARQAETIALNRYKSGLVSFLDVVYAQTSLLTNQRTATQIGGQRMVATVVLIKALGGGWLGVPAQPGTNPNSGSPGAMPKRG